MLSGAIHFKGRRAWENMCEFNVSLPMDNLPAALKNVAIVRLPYVAFPDVVGVFVYVSGQAEVTDLHDVALWQENVPGCQVSMDTLRIHTRSHTHHNPALCTRVPLNIRASVYMHWFHLVFLWWGNYRQDLDLVNSFFPIICCLKTCLCL